MTDSDPGYPAYQKFGVEELMELVDLFLVPAEKQARIRRILEEESQAPSPKLFRYYNEQSKVQELERRFRERMGSRYALGVNSGTSALIASLVAAGVGPGTEVIVPGYTFFASASAVVVAKGVPVITEVDESLTLDPLDVERKITERTRAILAVHMVGHPARMDALRQIADKHDLALIEDVAQAAGGAYRGRPLGAWGDLGCFSFDAYKTMATGEGGMVVTDDEWLYTRAQSYHDTAACWRPDRYARERTPGELFCGENYRMSELSGAVGLAQLRKLDWATRNTRRVYHQLRKETELPDRAGWIEPNDPDGVCGYCLGILLDSRASAGKVVEADIGLNGLARGDAHAVRNWHLYNFWEHVLEQKTPTGDGCPFRCPLVKRLPDYSEDMCPRTRDIIYRSVFLNIVPTMTPEWASWRAKKLTGELRTLLG